MCYNDPVEVYDMRGECYITLRPYMRWSPYNLTSKVSEMQWEDALRHSVADEEWDVILQGRSRC